MQALSANIVQVQHQRQNRRRVAHRGGPADLFEHIACARQQPADADAAHRGAEQPDRAEHAEPPAHARRHRQRVVALLLGKPAEHPLLGIGRDDDLPAQRGGPEPPAEQVADDQKLGGGLGGFAGFADDVELRAFQLRAEQVEHRPEADRIDVVEHEQPRPAALRGRQQVVLRRVQRGLKRDIAEGRAADAEHDEVLAAGAMPADRGLHVSQHLLVIRKVTPGVPAGRVLAFELAQQRRELSGGGPQLAGVHAVGRADAGAGRAGWIELEHGGHRRLPISSCRVGG